MEAIEMILLDEPGPFIVKVYRGTFLRPGYLIKDDVYGSIDSHPVRAAVHATRTEAEAYRDRWTRSWETHRMDFPDTWRTEIVRPETEKYDD